MSHEGTGRDPACGLVDALLLFRAEVPELPKDAEGQIQSRRYRYTTLGKIVELTQPLLTKHGLVWTALPTIADGEPALAYKLLHVSGQTLEGVMKVPGAETSQGQGSGITYARRYAKVAVLDLVADEDDDGAAAMPSYQRESRAQPEGPSVDFREHAKGLTNEAINVARRSVGLPVLEKPWSSLAFIPEDKAEEFDRALDAARAAQ